MRTTRWRDGRRAAGLDAGREDREHSRRRFASFDPDVMDYGAYVDGWHAATDGAALSCYFEDEYRPPTYYCDERCRCFYCTNCAGVNG